MTTPLILLILLILFNSLQAIAIGSGATISATSTAVCGIVAAENNQNIQCRWLNGTSTHTLLPDIPFSSISGGREFFCGIRSGGYVMVCWDSVSFEPKRVYLNYSDTLESIAVGDDHVCGVVSGSGVVKCWRGDHGFEEPNGGDGFLVISSGSGFSCGVLKGSNRVRCWGSNFIGKVIESRFGGMEMVNVIAGSGHVCGFNSTGFVVCRGRNGSGQLDVPRNLCMEYSSLALGGDYSCGIRQLDGSVVCWGGGGFSGVASRGISFEMIASGKDFVCGLLSMNLSVMCWGPGWGNSTISGFGHGLSGILPGACVQSNCSCGMYTDSERLCNGNGIICKPCLNKFSIPLSPAPLPAFLNKTSGMLHTSKGLRRGLLAFAIVGSVGVFAVICAIIYWLGTGGCPGKKKIHNSVQPTIARAGANENLGSKNGQFSRSFSIRGQSSKSMRRQRSGTSSKRTDTAEEFSLVELAAATNNFSQENKIGSGSFGVVYRGKLLDGREVAIKRGEKSLKTKKLQENESAFESELGFLLRLHHDHLVRLVGYCRENDERLLVYEYMTNGALFNHLHKNNVDNSSSVLNFWKLRIKIALDASRGIEYLHNYAVPPIIHRDVKSSNILLDKEWSARVSDLGLSLMGQDPDHDCGPVKPVGTVGYIDPENYGLNVLTAKSDIYGLGVVLLELLTGQRALSTNIGKGTPVSVVDYAVPAIMNEDLATILDPRVGPPEWNEIEAVELMAHIAMRCVNREGKERPDIADVVANLERALALCEDSHSSISSNAIVIVPY